MPKALKRKLKATAKKKGLKGKRANAYVYGTMNKMGMMPKKGMMMSEKQMGGMMPKKERSEMGKMRVAIHKGEKYK